MFILLNADCALTVWRWQTQFNSSLSLFQMLESCRKSNTGEISISSALEKNFKNQKNPENMPIVSNYILSAEKKIKIQ